MGLLHLRMGGRPGLEGKALRHPRGHHLALRIPTRGQRPQVPPHESPHPRGAPALTIRTRPASRSGGPPLPFRERRRRTPPRPPRRPNSLAPAAHLSYLLGGTDLWRGRTRCPVACGGARNPDPTPARPGDEYGVPRTPGRFSVHRSSSSGTSVCQGGCRLDRVYWDRF